MSHLQEIKTSLNRNSFWFNVGAILIVLSIITLILATIIFIALAYPWLIIWSVNTLFSAAQIPYNFWTVIAFYILNIFFFSNVKTNANQDSSKVST
jgi:4-amino-4-deoxy-L-arabinose transferase-like glycosyltransferase